MEASTFCESRRPGAPTSPLHIRPCVDDDVFIQQALNNDQLTCEGLAASGFCATLAASAGEDARVSRPSKTVHAPCGTAPLGKSAASTACTSASSCAFASAVAGPSQSAASIPPSGSATLEPLSTSWLCDAVTHTPVAFPVARERSAASTPTRYLFTSALITAPGPCEVWGKAACREGGPAAIPGTLGARKGHT